MKLTMTFSSGSGWVVSRQRALAACLLIMLALLMLGACDQQVTGMKASAPHVPLVVATHKGSGAEVITTRAEVPKMRSFFAAENLRATVFSGNTEPRLAGGAPERTGFLDTSRVNTGADGQSQARGEVYLDIAGEEVVVESIPRQQILGGQWQPPRGSSGNIELNFNDEPLPQVIRNVMGGILGLNFIIGDSVTGTLTFRSERRFSQTELLQVMADILARRGYVIQFFNSIYHIGAPAELEALTGLRQRSQLEADATHVIRLRGRAPDNLADVVNSLIPPGNTITDGDGAGQLIVRGDPSQFASIEGLVRSLVDSRPGVQALAIIPVRRAPPETIAEQIQTVYSQRNLGEILVVPVESVPGILVVANTRDTVSQVSTLVRQLDVERRDRAQVRVIQLNHLNATEVVASLSSVLGSGSIGGAANGGDSAAEGSAIIAAAIESANTGEPVRTSTNGLRAPRFIRGADQPGDTAPAAANGGATAGVASASGDQISFSADTRSNSVLVRSNFQEFQRIQEIVRVMDVPQAQVVIEATIIEVDINDQLQYGVQLFLERFGVNVRSSSGAGTTADPGGGGFVGTLNAVRGATSIQAVVTALQSVTNVRVISSPYLTVVDGATSRLNVGDQIPFVIASQTSQSGGQVTVTQEIDTRDVGVILDVTPRISPSNSVTLDIVQEVSSARVAQTVAGSNPIVSQRRVQSQIVVQSGGTVLLGGLIQERSDTGENGVPVLRRVPVLGNMFNRTDNTMARSELLVLITPRVVRNSDTLDGLTRQLRSQLTRR